MELERGAFRAFVSALAEWWRFRGPVAVQKFPVHLPAGALFGGRCRRGNSMRSIFSMFYVSCLLPYFLRLASAFGGLLRSVCLVYLSAVFFWL